METIAYERDYFTDASQTRCPYRRGRFVGSRACIFCKYCKGATLEAVKCTFKEVVENPVKKVKLSFDVMVKGEFRKTISVIPSGLKIIKGELHRVITESDISKAVEEMCPHTFRYEEWNVEINTIAEA